MRLVTFTDGTPNGAKRVGVLVPVGPGPHTHVADVTAAAADASTPLHRGMRQLLEQGDAGLKTAARAAGEKRWHVPLASVKLVAPIWDPEKVICVGMNYRDHCTEQDFPIPTEPVLFSKFASAIASDGDPIPLEPSETKKLDFEVELVVVIGKSGRRISKADAMDHIAGYTVAHDVSARDWQMERNGGQWLIGKTFDGFAPIGPAIVTKDELGDPCKLDIRCLLNGVSVQSSNTKNLIFTPADVVEYASRFMTLNPGDIFLTGTPGGVGVFRKPPMFLKDGDEVVCEIDGIGKITNTIMAHVPAKL